ncbi:hypothetical protein ACFLZW_05560 [Chloroflexota bacterium]
MSVLFLSACGPSRAELDAAATQTAPALFKTQTAGAPTSTPRPTATAAATLTPTSTSTSTPTPVLATRTPVAPLPTEPPPTPTDKAPVISEILPTSAGLSAAGKAAYDNIAHLLLTTAELDAVYDFEDVGWVFMGDGPGLYFICRTFEHPDIAIHAKFFSCVGRVVAGIDLEKDDLGWYEMLKTYESAYKWSSWSRLVMWKRRM